MARFGQRMSPDDAGCEQEPERWTEHKQQLQTQQRVGSVVIPGRSVEAGGCEQGQRQPTKQSIF